MKPVQLTFDFDVPEKLKPGEVVLNCRTCGTPFIYHGFTRSDEWPSACCREHWVKYFCSVWQGENYLFFKNLCQINEITDDEVLRAQSS